MADSDVTSSLAGVTWRSNQKITSRASLHYSQGGTAWAAVHFQTVTAGKPSFLAMLCSQPTISCAKLLECERHRKVMRCS